MRSRSIDSQDRYAGLKRVQTSCSSFRVFKGRTEVATLGIGCGLPFKPTFCCFLGGPGLSRDSGDARKLDGRLADTPEELPLAAIGGCTSELLDVAMIGMTRSGSRGGGIV